MWNSTENNLGKLNQLLENLFWMQVVLDILNIDDQRMLRLFIGFCICSYVALTNLSTGIILAFMEILMHIGSSHSSLSNLISSIKSILALNYINTDCLEHPKGKIFIRSVQINRPLVVSQNYH